MTRPRHTLLPVAATLVLLACGEATPDASQAAKGAPAPQATGLDPCQLLTADEIQSRLAWRPDSARGSGYGTTGTCNHFGPGGMAQQVTLVVGQGMRAMATSADMAAWRKEQYKGYDVGAIVEPIEGLGVPAIRNEVAGLVSIEMVVAGKLVSVGAMSQLDKVRDLAALVVPRIK